MKLTPVLALLATPLFTPSSAQQLPQRDMRPIYSYLAFPRVGTRVPDFNYALASGGMVTPKALEGAPTVLVLWSTWCAASRRILSDVEALNATYEGRGVHILILAADSMPELREFRMRVPVHTALAAAPDLMESFDFSSTAPERDSLRVAFALPGVLVLDRAGVVVSRDGLSASSFAGLRETLNHLLDRR